MNKIKIENNYSWLLSQDEDVKITLWKSLRFREHNYYHNPLFKQKKWDGYTDFFKKETGRFLTGLLPEVKAALRHLGVTYDVEDKRTDFQFAVGSVDSNLLGESFILRDYQVHYINQVIKHKRGIIPSPTGSGKTGAMVGILKALPVNTPTLILVNKKQLVEQNYDVIQKFGIPRVGRFYGNVKKPDMITCATVQSAHLLEPLLPKIKVLLVDEIHEMMSKQPKWVYARLKNASVRVGMSATAFKFGGSDKGHKYDVKGWIGPLFTSHYGENGILTTKQLQERDILADADSSFIEVDQPLLPYDVYLDAVTRGIAENEYFHDMVTSLAQKLAGRSLIIVERIEHGDRLQERMPHALWVRGEDTMETRKQIINRLKTEEGNLVAIATSGIFNTGIDVFVHNLINAAGGQADHQIIQRFGRGLRRATDKERLHYYDFVFLINDYLEKHSFKRMRVLQKEGHAVKLYKCLEEVFSQ